MKCKITNYKSMLKRLLFVLNFCALSCLGTFAQSTMSDQQVLDYVKTNVSAGKTMQVIAKELASKGVNRAQAERVKKLYENSKGGEVDDVQNAQNNASRAHNTVTRSVDAEDLDKQSTIVEKVDDNILATASNTIFGYSIFKNKALNFAPSESLATPRNYRLGPGDEVIIDVYGANQTTLRQTISPEGSINVDVLGPVYLNGMTIEDANTFLKKKLSTIFAGLGRTNDKTDIRVSLGQIRTIQINVLGEVRYPGTYTLSSFATVFHALYKAGGVIEPGTLRNIKVSRNGRTIATVDVYEFLMHGTRNSDVRLEEGDVVLVAPYKTMVKVEGKVKRPMYFELKDGESLKTLIEYAGGYSKGAYTSNTTIIRQTGREYEVCTVDEMDYSVFKMKDGDEVQIGELVSKFQNRISIKGAVYRTGLFQLDSETNTVRSLINKADGLMPEAFTSHAILSRENDDRSLEVLSVDIDAILNGTVPDIPLKNNDELFIPSQYEIKDFGTVTITGEVALPSTYPFAKNMTIEDLILQAGGLLDAASTCRIDVSRRIRDSKQAKAQQKIGELLSFSIDENLAIVEGDTKFKLAPYDIVYVRKSPAYYVPKNVSIKGEVNFEGTYPLTTKNERLSDLVNKAGGATDYAYLKGARLIRKVNEAEIVRMKKVLKGMGADAFDMEQLDFNTKYYVGIDLDKALEKPGSEYDVVLREGDQLVIPEYVNTVRVDGAVQSPVDVTYSPGMRVRYYINQSGGFANRAKKSRMYMIGMNGHISRVKKRTKVDTGAEIIVPLKEPRNDNSLQTSLSLATTSTSLATMIASIANILK